MVAVSTAAELMSALGQAKAGDVISLAAGNYGQVTIAGLKFASDVTIVSADPDHPAIFDTLRVVNSSHLVIDGVAAAHALSPGEPDYVATMRVDKSSFVTIRNCEVSGSVDGNYRNDGQGLLVDQSDNVLIEGNNFHDLKAGVGAGRSDGVTVRGNDIHDIRSDGILIGAASNVLVENNTIGTFHTAQDLGDHPDMIQVFNNNAVHDMENLTIRGNVLIQGGGDNVQGIFIQGAPPGLADTYGFVTRNVQIDHNIVSVGAAQGIWVADVTGVAIDHNTVLADPASGIMPSIQTNRTVDAAVTSNVAMGITGKASTGTTFGGNAIANAANPYSDQALNQLFLNPAATSLTAADLAPNPNGALVLSHAADTGAIDLENFGAEPRAILAVDHKAMPDIMTYVFDGSFSTHSASDISGYAWDFGDGTTAGGARVTHNFAHAGVANVTLSVSYLDGSTKVTTSEINVIPVKVLDLGLNHGIGNSAEDKLGAVAHGKMTYVRGVKGEAALFNGEAYAGAGNAIIVNQGPEALVNGMPELTASLWFEKTALASGTQRILWLNGSYGIELVDKNAARFLLNTDNGDVVTMRANTVGIADTNWHQAVMTYDGQTARAYIDGVEVAHQGGLSGHLKPLGAQDLVIGANPFGASFHGTIDEVKIHNDAEGASMIAANFLALKPTALPVDPVPPPPPAAPVSRQVLTGTNGGNKLVGGTGNDTLNGNGGNDQLYGGAGNDTINGGSGNDRILGGAGLDLMNGGAGKDQLTGGAGNDRLTGGADSDIFVFSKVAGGTGHDTIMDFQHGIDDIRFVGLSAAHRMANLAITHTPDGTWHVAYNDGIGKAVIDVHFTGAHLLTADDFIFL